MRAGNSPAIALSPSVCFLLKGDKQQGYSIRINDKYRLEFSIEKDKGIIIEEIIVIEEAKGVSMPPQY